MVRFYLLKEDINDATAYYISILKDGIEKAGQDVDFVEDLSAVRKNDYVVCIVPKTFWRVLKNTRRTKTIFWFQGVTPEEVDFYDFPFIKRQLSKLRYTFLEWLILNTSVFNFFVSNTMLWHYQRKYGYKRNNWLVMPCFNQKILKSAFSNTKYQEPSFVYTGSLANWQCFEPAVQLFKEIQGKIGRASLTIYTKEKDKAIRILEKYNIDATIKYVPYQQLSDELKHFKYGFIIREDNTVNNVATPTKMNSYLANGIIPIYTDIVGAYKENLNCLRYAIPLSVDNTGLDKLFELESQRISGDDVYEDYKKIFYKYYNREFYVNKIAETLKGIIL